MTTVADRPDEVLVLPAGEDDAPARTYRPPILEWLTTTDHKKIGIMYMVTAFLFFMLGGVEALYIRTELAAPGLQFFDENAYNQLFTIHATIMVFLFVMPMLSGLGNYILPLQIGAPDMAFPRINALSFWMVPLGGIILLSSYFVEGGPAATGWTFYSPLSQAKYNGTGADLWLAAITILGVATTLGGVNFLVTVFKMRAPGMTMLRMPIFCWTVVVTAVLSVLSLPVVASAFIMLFIDRNFGGRFFDPAVGGDAILYQHIFWFFAHPEVYILVLPAMGVVSEIIPVFSRKPLFGYTAFIYATCGIGALGFSVWAHHMLTTGAVAVTFFSGMTALIGVPTGVKFFNWLATMWRGKVLLATPMLFAVGFMFTFLIGGITGVFLSAVTVDYALHDTYFVVGHFHFTVFGGATFGIYGALYYWFPKFSGRKLNERVGKVHFWLHFAGTMLLFSPMLVLGAMGMPRRIADYGADRAFQGWNVVATIGAYTVALSVLPFLYNVVITLKRGRRCEEDPWQANTLEWATSSPPPPHNFDAVPPVHSERPLWDLRLARAAAAGDEGAKELMAHGPRH